MLRGNDTKYNVVNAAFNANLTNPFPITEAINIGLLLQVLMLSIFIMVL